MRWVSWLLGIVGIVQYAVIVATDATGYVSVDMSYLVMFLCIIAALFLCYVSCWGYGGCQCGGDCDCGCCGDDGACDCCEDHCHCGDCDACDPASHGHGDGGHEGHAH